MAEQATDQTVITGTNFPYTALQTPCSFRLLRILHESDTSNNIHCTIEEHDRGDEECPRYTALFYAWGDTKSRRPIDLNGRTVLVTKNLYEALLHLRHRVPNIFIWIDTLCIDQENPAERGHQVTQMRAIYSEAQRVVSWLGPAGESVAILFNTIRRHHRTCTPVFVADGNCMFMYDQGIDGTLRYIIELAYWTRIWIVQEIVVATSLTLMCGDNMIPWRVFAKFVKLAYYGHFDNGIILPQCLGRRIHESPRIFRLLHWGHKDVSFADALAWTSGSHATDVRDRIYAIIGLVSTGEHIEADYTLSSCAVLSKAIHVRYAGLPAYMHALARRHALNRDWYRPGKKHDTTSEGRKYLQWFQATEGESADATSLQLLQRSARALAISRTCEEAAQLVPFLFPKYKTRPRIMSSDGDTTEPYQYTPCGGEQCALNYVLNQMIQLSRAGRDS
jgi:hypothetical protein